MILLRESIMNLIVIFVLNTIYCFQIEIMISFYFIYQLLAEDTF